MSTKWTVITGASGNLGEEFARLAAAEGRDLVLIAQQGAKLEALAEDLRKRHKIAVEILSSDLSDPEAVESLWRRIEMRRQVDVLVNNADHGNNGSFARDDISGDMASIMVNVVAMTILMKRAVTHMNRHGGGRVLNISPAADPTPTAQMAVHRATRAYALSLSEAVASEHRDGTVTVTVLRPHDTTTALADGARPGWNGLFNLFLASSARGVARAGWRAMKKGKRIRVTGLPRWLLAFAPRPHAAPM